MPKPKKNCHDTALDMLSRRGYAIKEMQDALTKKGFEPQDITDVMTRLQEKKFLDDATFALSRARYRATVSGWGRTRIKQELWQKGVAEDFANAAVLEVSEPADEYAEEHDFQQSANDVLARRFKPLHEMFPENLTDELRLKHQKEIQRRVSFLVRRGFSLQEAKIALEVTEEF